ncbi:sigma-54 interaction domain-containing protein [Brevibacillus choshinensis]|uniref:Sigma 54-interacting transcriptional regulator n=1 Tax=Brevibacillus choshinensis TaxID=54911 RepID=A0ABX7FLZ5_BRECH|nr:sigma 54-interacting transcriptional regulator [Brevibacillus choshinensis]QRG67279.1 sigma 54-interacting transcriptional regulator [Brevibacillus choshinensis]
MTKAKPRVLLINKMETVSHLFVNNLKLFFGERIEMDAHFGLNPIEQNRIDRADLILSADIKLLQGQPMPPDHIPVLVARRTIDLNNLDRLMDLKPGTRCLFVSNTFEMVEGAIELLRHLGFSHLTFIPYVPDTDIPLPEKEEVDYAVCHGLPELVPAHFDRIIELGHRPLDLTTIFDIARLLDLSPEKANLYTAEFISDFVRMGRKLTDSANNERQLNEKLESILNAVHEGIIATDAFGNITLINEEAEKILKLPSVEIIGRRVQDVLPEFQVNVVLDSHSEAANQLTPFRNLYLLVTQIPMMLDGQVLGLVITFQDVTKVQQLEQEIRKKSTQLGLMTKYSFDHIIGCSQSTQVNKQVAMKLAESDFTILITGENGTGKEVFAQAIHQHSIRRDGPFVPVNFAGLTESLVESELFGYEEGSFTGARKGGKMGLFELAHNGTIFLDEIGDAPLSIQAALLRVLQERQVMRVGGHRVIPVNVRVIAATNRNLVEMIRKGAFREDLYYRLNVLPLQIPPLRDRGEDIMVLIDHFLQKKNKVLTFVPEVTDLLLKYSWPGNIRELENFIHYAVVIADGNRVELRHLPEPILQAAATEPLSSEQGEIEETIGFLARHGSLHEYESILQILYSCSKRQERIGRQALNALLPVPMTDAQIRQKLLNLSRTGCLEVGVKKQGTRLTTYGFRLLESLKTRV